MKKLVFTIEHDGDGRPCGVEFEGATAFLEMVVVARVVAAALAACVVADHVNSRADVAAMAARVEALSDAVGAIESAAGLSPEEGVCTIDGMPAVTAGRA